MVEHKVYRMVHFQPECLGFTDSLPALVLWEPRRLKSSWIRFTLSELYDPLVLGHHRTLTALVKPYDRLDGRHSPESH